MKVADLWHIYNGMEQHSTPYTLPPFFTMNNLQMDDLCLTLILSRLNQEDVASLSQLLPSMLLRCMRVAGPVLVNSPQILRLV